VPKDILGLIAVIIAITSWFPYAYDMWKGRIKPHAFSWIIWGLVQTIAFFAQYSQGGGAGAWAMAGLAITCWLNVIYAVWRGERQVTKSDWATFSLALACIPIWVLTGNPLGAVILVSCIDILGFYPTLRKSYAKPYEENLTVFVMGALACAVGLLATESYSLTTCLYPSTMVVINFAFVAVTAYRRRVLSR
jgi:hypothetical protein